MLPVIRCLAETPVQVISPLFLEWFFYPRMAVASLKHAAGNPGMFILNNLPA